MKYRLPSTVCSTEGCENERRPSGRLCNACHAAAQREYRLAAKQMRGESPGLLEDAIRATKRVVLLDAIKAENGNFCAAAIRIGVHRNTINRLLRELNISTLELRAYVKARQVEQGRAA